MTVDFEASFAAVDAAEQDYYAALEQMFQAKKLCLRKLIVLRDARMKIANAIEGIGGNAAAEAQEITGVSQ